MALPLLLSPGTETVNSQINQGNHPLGNDWIEFRQLISVHNIINNYNEYLLGKVEFITKKLMINRLNFSFSKKFLPLYK